MTGGGCSQKGGGALRVAAPDAHRHAPAGPAAARTRRTRDAAAAAAAALAYPRPAADGDGLCSPNSTGERPAA